MRFEKLVRDRIPDIIRAKGETPVTHVADEAEYWKKLRDKLKEEVIEFLESESPEEVADVLEVIVALCAAKGWTLRDIEQMRSKKAAERGGFWKRIILESKK